MSEDYFIYSARRAREAHNLGIFIEQLAIALPPLVFGGFLLLLTTSGGNVENPVCTSLICAVQGLSLLLAACKYSQYK